MPRPLAGDSHVTATPSGINGILQNGWVKHMISASQAFQKHRQQASFWKLDCLLCRPCVAGFVAFFIAQSLKVLTHWYSEGRWDFTRVIGSGGMPSSHTACVSMRWPVKCVVHIQDRTEFDSRCLACRLLPSQLRLEPSPGQTLAHLP